MLKNNKLSLLSQLAKERGEGTLVAFYNDIEEKWYYYVGDFKPKNPSNHIHHHSMRGKCINKVLDNEFIYFSGDIAKAELIGTEFEKLIVESFECDFRFVWIK